VVNWRWCIQLDLADLESIKKFVEDFRATGKELSVLINNGGVALNFKDTKRQYTKDNFELTMGTNHIGNVQLITQNYLCSAVCRRRMNACRVITAANYAATQALLL